MDDLLLLFEGLFGFGEDNHLGSVGQSDDQIIDPPEAFALLDEVLIILAARVIDFGIEFFGRHEKSLLFLVDVILYFD